MYACKSGNRSVRTYTGSLHDKPVTGGPGCLQSFNISLGGVDVAFKGHRIAGHGRTGDANDAGHGRVLRGILGISYFNAGHGNRIALSLHSLYAGQTGRGLLLKGKGRAGDADDIVHSSIGICEMPVGDISNTRGAREVRGNTSTLHGDDVVRGVPGGYSHDATGRPTVIIRGDRSELRINIDILQADAIARGGVRRHLETAPAAGTAAAPAAGKTNNRSAGLQDAAFSPAQGKGIPAGRLREIRVYSPSGSLYAPEPGKTDHVIRNLS